MTTTQKNFRLDEHYVGLLAWLSERYGASESEIVRRALDYVNYQSGLATSIAEKFIERLRDEHGAEARIEFRAHDDDPFPDYYDVLVNGELDEGLVGTIRVAPLEERIRGIERVRVYLEASTSSSYGGSVGGLRPELYIGELDQRSPATLSIRVGDLTKEMQEFWGLVGAPQDRDETPAWALMPVPTKPEKRPK